MHAAVGRRGLLGLFAGASTRLRRAHMEYSEPSFILLIERGTYNDFFCDAVTCVCNPSQPRRWSNEWMFTHILALFSVLLGRVTSARIEASVLGFSRVLYNGATRTWKSDMSQGA